MVKRGSDNYKFAVGGMQKRGPRYADRRREQQHQKKLKGSHFIRMANWEDITSEHDSRIYNGPDKTPLTAATAKEGFDILVDMYTGTAEKWRGLLAHDGIAIQLFTAEGELVEENLGLLYKSTAQGAEIMIPHRLYKQVVASIRNRGVGYTFSKHADRRIVKQYEGKPYEYLCDLPLRKIVSMADEKFKKHQSNPTSYLAPFLKEAYAKGMNMSDAYTYAFGKFHKSQGRSEQGDKASHRPLSNCACCHKRENQKNRFKACGACKMVFYCCKDCQVKNWNNHKTFCKKNRQ
jgi:hypothetical protein